MLRFSGKFFLREVVVADDEPLNQIRKFVDDQAQSGDEKSREDAEGHFREEFSPTTGIKEGLPERAGFTIDERSLEDGVFAEHLTVKEG